eukprot:scaffold1900_cov389-Prasinococcus_capsulatus_cf.AAC.18
MRRQQARTCTAIAARPAGAPAQREAPRGRAVSAPGQPARPAPAAAHAPWRGSGRGRNASAVRWRAPDAAPPAAPPPGRPAPPRSGRQPSGACACACARQRESSSRSQPRARLLASTAATILVRQLRRATTAAMVSQDWRLPSRIRTLKYCTRATVETVRRERERRRRRAPAHLAPGRRPGALDGCARSFQVGPLGASRRLGVRGGGGHEHFGDVRTGACSGACVLRQVRARRWY